MSEYSQIYCHISCQNIPKYIAIYQVRIFPNILSYIMSEYSQIYCQISCQNIPKYIVIYHGFVWKVAIIYNMFLLRRDGKWLSLLKEKCRCCGLQIWFKADLDSKEKENWCYINFLCIKNIWDVQKELRHLIFVILKWRSAKTCKKSDQNSLKW